MEYVVLVDEQDKELGTKEKLQAHVDGDLHRAISVFIFNSKHELLLQQRSMEKYHSAGLWTNTCCSHPRPGENATDAAHRRLMEEMGMKAPLSEVFSFMYKASLEHGLTEHEFDHVFTGISDAIPSPDESEVGAWKYIELNALEAEIKNHPEEYTEWFKICLRDWKNELFGL